MGKICNNNQIVYLTHISSPKISLEEPPENESGHVLDSITVSLTAEGENVVTCYSLLLQGAYYIS